MSVLIKEWGSSIRASRVNSHDVERIKGCMTSPQTIPLRIFLTITGVIAAVPLWESVFVYVRHHSWEDRPVSGLCKLCVPTQTNNGWRLCHVCGSAGNGVDDHTQNIWDIRAKNATESTRHTECRCHPVYIIMYVVPASLFLGFTLLFLISLSDARLWSTESFVIHYQGPKWSLWPFLLGYKEKELGIEPLNRGLVTATQNIFWKLTYWNLNFRLYFRRAQKETETWSVYEV